MKYQSTAILAWVAGTLMTLPAAASATSTNYGNYFGSTVVYSNVTESSITDALPLYNAPLVAGNTMDFNPTGFGATASNGGIDLTDGQLTFDIYAMPGNAIEKLMFAEGGDFHMIGTGSTNTYVQVGASFFVDIIAVDGVDLPTTISIDTQMTFTPSTTGQFLLPDYTGLNQLWSGSLNVDLNQALDDEAISYSLGATTVRVNLDNALVALSETGTAAYIAKKNFNAFSITVVPELSTAALGFLGMAALLAARRNRTLASSVRNAA